MFEELNLSNKQKKELFSMTLDIMRLEKVVNPPIRKSIKRLLEDMKNIIYDENLDYDELVKTVYEKIKEEVPEQDRKYIKTNVMYIIEKYHNLIIWKIDGKIIVQKKKSADIGINNN